jgi:hypothetical protein
MKRSEAEKLLGGYATGTLTTEERRELFAAALGQQALFEALLDEEILRELLADPEAKAQLLAALAPSATPKVVPFWRRTGVLGAAASLMVAATAGLAYLRSPSALPRVVPPTLQEPAAKVAEAPAAKTAEAPVAKAAEAPGAKTSVAKSVEATGAKAGVAAAADQGPAPALRGTAPVLSSRSAEQPRQETAALLAPAPPAPAPKPLALPSAAAQEDSARLKEKADFRQAEARDQLDKKAEVSRQTATAAKEADAAHRGDAQERKATTHDPAAGGVPAVSGSMVGGAAPASPSPAAAKAKAAGGLATNAATAPTTPTWALEAQPDGRTRVTVSAPRGQTVTLLRRSPAGVEVLPLQARDDRGKALVQWRAELRLAPGDLLDLYLLKAPAAEPARLPETGPVDGFRVRIHPGLNN